MTAADSSTLLLSYLPDGTILEWPAEAERLFGCPSGQVVGRDITGILAPVGCLRAPDSVIRPDVGPELLAFISRRDGSLFLLDAEVKPILSNGRAVERLELRLRAPPDGPAEATVKALDQMVETAPDAAILVGGDGRIVTVNGRAERLSGYSRRELEGKPVDLLVPIDRREAHARFRSAYAGRPSARPMGTGLDLWLRRKDGSAVPVDISLQPIRTASGFVVVAAMRDMTERQRSEARFVSMIEDAPDGIVVADPEGRIVLANCRIEALFGYDREELLGQPVEILIPESRREPHRQARIGYMRAPVPRAMGERPILHGRRKDGTLIAIDIALSPLGVGRDGPLVMVAVRDASTRERLEEAKRRAIELETASLLAQRAIKVRGDFIAGLSHELRTPLTSILGFAELLKGEDGVPFKGDPGPYLDGIMAAARHMSGLVADVLDLASIEAGRTSFSPEPVDLEAVANDVREVLWPLAQEKRIALSLHVAPALPDAVVDPVRLRQILINLVSNAIKFTPPDGQVELRLAPEAADRFCIEVADSGPGMTPEDLSRLFTPFERVGSPGKPKPPGSGLGLAITKRLVEGQGGTIGVDSTPGRGSVFRVVMPCRPAVTPG